MSEARRIRVRGQVQGVGFRPFIWTLARAHGLTGSVLNDPKGVLIYAAGEGLDAFVAAIPTDAPPLARVDCVDVSPHSFDEIPVEFVIAASAGRGAETRVTPDAATCAGCIDDIRGRDPRRRDYPFTNCTHCGPRFTILNDLPYDRAKTSMAGFEMCADCAQEYADPADRRFHAQPVACASCGPQIWFETASGRVEGDALDLAAEALLRGEILAVKGLGGFHVCCDATDVSAIEKLRQRKHRPSKPLALMGRWEDIAQYGEPTAEERDALADPSAPIVLLGPSAALPEALAPGQGTLGWMLPYTPLHHLLMDRVARPLVMTSGNLSGEPQVIGNDEARIKLSGIVDGYVMHDRDIVRRLDDSVMRHTPHGPMILRHARGRVPGTLPLPDGFEDAPQVVSFGGQMKAAICLIKNGQALLSHHLGELDEALTHDAFLQADRDYAALFDHHPDYVACDLHPDFRASQHAHQTGLPVIEVQHHHAHLAACLAENGWPLDRGPVAGIILDGLGLGTDGTVWGGEVLLGDYRGFRRHAHLAPAPLIGGDRAQAEPWRNLLARLDRAGLSAIADQRLEDRPRDLLRRAALAGMNSPLSSSAGRLFDAFACALGLGEEQSFEGEAAMRLEALAAEVPPGADARHYRLEAMADPGALDDSPLWIEWQSDLAAGVAPQIMAWRFHAALAQAFARTARDLVASSQAEAVALSGGCFQNALLLDLTLGALKDVPVLHHTRVPANDGGLALGQAVVAAAQAQDSR